MSCGWDQTRSQAQRATHCARLPHTVLSFLYSQRRTQNVEYKKLVLSSCSIYGTYKIQSRKVSWVCQFLLNDYTLRYQIWRLKIIKKITKYTWVKNRHSQFLSDKFKMKGRKGCTRFVL